MVDVCCWLFIDVSKHVFGSRNVVQIITQLGEPFWVDRVCKVLYYWLVLRVLRIFGKLKPCKIYSPLVHNQVNGITITCIFISY